MTSEFITLDNMQFTKKVNDGHFPSQTIVPIDSGFIDERGEIKNLLLTPITSVAEIRSVRGAVRANHYHLTDWHYAYVISGQILYYERDVDSTDMPTPTEIKPGEMFFTPPMREHAMLFTQDSVIMTFAKNIRSHDSHESDVVRVSFVTPEVVSKVLT